MDSNKVCLITLGCPKNIVEGESLAGIIKSNGFILTCDINQADTAVVHTCSFINDAKAESSDVVNALSQIKKQGKLRKIIVTGCMVQDEGLKIKTLFPGVDAFLGTGSLGKIANVLKNSQDILSSPGGLLESAYPRLLSSLLPVSYLRISEGCNHRCSFCSIPKIRGKYSSRKIESIVKEAEDLAFNKVKEIILIAQDTTNYGKDLYGKYALPELLRKLENIDKVKWLRLMYAYPGTLNEEMLKCIRDSSKILNYIDIPLQHVSRNVLRNMLRPQNAVETVTRIKNTVPGISIRTTFIVGFPGESKRDFAQLCRFVREGWFEHLGIFKYSRNPKTSSYNYYKQVPAEETDARYNELMLIQKEVVKKRNKERIGNVFECIIENQIDKNTFTGRAWFQAPEVDSKIIVKGKLKTGEFGKIKIDGLKGYDLRGHKCI